MKLCSVFHSGYDSFIIPNTHWEEKIFWTCVLTNHREVPTAQYHVSSLWFAFLIRTGTHLVERNFELPTLSLREVNQTDDWVKCIWLRNKPFFCMEDPRDVFWRLIHSEKEYRWNFHRRQRQDLSVWSWLAVIAPEKDFFSNWPYFVVGASVPAVVFIHSFLSLLFK